jgi:hypothetical protein
MDALYNWHVRRFYDSRGYRRRFAKRLWQHRWSLWHFTKNLPKIVQAARYFSANQKQLERLGSALPAHPRQPTGLEPQLSEDLKADALAAVTPVQVTRRSSAEPMLPKAG